MEDRPWWIMIRCAWDGNRPSGQRWTCKLVLVLDAEGPAEPDLVGFSERYPGEVITSFVWKPTCGIQNLRIEGPEVLKDRYGGASRREQGPYRAVVLETIRAIVVNPPPPSPGESRPATDPSNN